MLITKNYCVFS